ncbi:MAG: hypothetical protein HQL01_15150, partial [Nitrospirae bacterium]|nr:hypothetical protein [Nitrospirota bacterium]
MYEITRIEILSPTTFLWDVRAPEIARAARPGQFVIVRCNETAERIPLTIADFDSGAGTVTIVIQAAGKSTFEMMDYKAGDRISDIAGPL